jgi:hypothetical protein
MPEVQKPVLEHAPTKTREEEITRAGDVVNLVTRVINPLSVRKTDRGYEAEFSMEELRSFLASDPPERFYVRGVPVPASASLAREALAGMCPI